MAGTSAAPGVCWVIGTTPAAGEGWGGEPGLHAPLPCPELLGSRVLPPLQGRGEGGQNHRYFQTGKTTVVGQLPLLPSYLWPWGLCGWKESCASSAVTTRFLEAAGSVTVAAGSRISSGRPSAGLRILPPLCVPIHSLLCIQMCGYLESWYVGQKNLCGIMNVLLVLD